MTSVTAQPMPAIAIREILSAELDLRFRRLGELLDEAVRSSGQLAFPASRNGHHRAELQKHFVGTRFQVLGIGRFLMTALHDGALQRRRSLIILNVRRGDSAERLYRGLGYREAGVVPGYTLGPRGERFDNATLYVELQRSSNSTEY